MEAIAVFMYVLYFPLTLFENMMIVRPFVGMKPAWMYGQNQVNFQIVVRLVALVSVALIGWQFTFVPALVAFIAAIVFSRVTFRFFSSKYTY